MEKADKYSLGMDFHNNSKEPMSPTSFDPKIPYKIYHNARSLSMEKNDVSEAMQLQDDFLRVLLMRKSTRCFAKSPVDSHTLAKLLTMSLGLRNDENDSPRRTYASAGGRYPIEAYVVILRSASCSNQKDSSNTDDLKQGVYHYNVVDNTLEFIKAGDYSDEIKHFYRNQESHLDLNFPCLIIFSMVFLRSMEKYGEKGYRFALMDAGHMSQNLYLVAEYLGLGIVSLGGGAENDEFLDGILSLVSDEENAFYGFAVGAPNM